METDDDHATIKESFSLVQNILFIEYTDVFPAHLLENIVENGGKLCNLVCFSDIVLWRELLVSLVTWLKPIQEFVNCPVSSGLGRGGCSGTRHIYSIVPNPTRSDA